MCGPYRVPFLLNLPGSGHRVAGELYAITPRGLAWLDDLEGVSRSHYERLPVSVLLLAAGGAAQAVEALAYYAHRDYAVSTADTRSSPRNTILHDAQP